MSEVILQFKDCFPNTNYTKHKYSDCADVRWHTADARFGSMKSSSSRKLPIEALLHYPYWFNTTSRTSNDLRNRQHQVKFTPSQTELALIRPILDSLISADRSGKLKIDAKRYVEAFFDTMTTSNSLIAKQISKQQPGLTLPFWKEVFISMIQPNSSHVVVPFQTLQEYHDFLDVYGTPGMASYSESKSLYKVNK